MFQRRGHGAAPICWPATSVDAKPVAQRLDAFIDDLFVRHVARQHHDVGAPIDRLALAEQAVDGAFGIGGLQQRPVGAPPHPAHDHLGIGLEPDRDRLVADTVARLLAHEGAAAGRDHRRAAVEQPRDHPRLAVAEMRLAMGLENVGDRHARRGLDLGIGIDKGQLEPGRHPPPDGGLAGPHHADQHDAARAERGRDLGIGRQVLGRRRGGVGHQGTRILAKLPRFRATYTTPREGLASQSCKERGKHAGKSGRLPPTAMVNLSPKKLPKLPRKGLNKARQCPPCSAS